MAPGLSHRFTVRFKTSGLRLARRAAGCGEVLCNHDTGVPRGIPRSDAAHGSPRAARSDTAQAR